MKCFSSSARAQITDGAFSQMKENGGRREESTQWRRRRPGQGNIRTARGKGARAAGGESLLLFPVLLSSLSLSPPPACCPLLKLSLAPNRPSESTRPRATPPTNTMQLKALLALAPLAAAQELMRFGCSQLTIDRIDPLVNPDQTPSQHMHQVIGGNSFNASMNPSNHDPPTVSSCTSCTYSEDFSNYWTANVYFRARNGSFKRVPQVANLGLGVKGGMTVYYIRGYQASAKVTTFKPVSLCCSWNSPRGGTAQAALESG